MCRRGPYSPIRLLLVFHACYCPIQIFLFSPFLFNNYPQQQTHCDLVLLSLTSLQVKLSAVQVWLNDTTRFRKIKAFNNRFTAFGRTRTQNQEMKNRFIIDVHVKIATGIMRKLYIQIPCIVQTLCKQNSILVLLHPIYWYTKIHQKINEVNITFMTLCLLCTYMNGTLDLCKCI